MRTFQKDFEKALKAVRKGKQGKELRGYRLNQIEKRNVLGMRKGMMCPSAATLEKDFGISRKAANQIRALCKAADEPEKLEELINKHHPSAERYVRSMYSDPYRSGMWRRTVILHAINDLVDGHGVEALGSSSGFGDAPPYEYINMGDTYDLTLIYKRDTDRLFAGTWGDLVERNPKLGSSY